MAHTLHTTHHIQRPYWVAFEIPVVLVMASIIWVVMVFSERPTFGVIWDRLQMAPPSSNSVPAAEYPWCDWIRSSTPIGITDLPGRLDGNWRHVSAAARTTPCG
jgi:hypothetical protein